jgi:two-component system sensor histidine kinase KdpD
MRPNTAARSTARTETSEFVELLKARERGKLKVYIGSAAGVGKTFRMLQEAHDLRRRGIDVVVGFVETHNRAETASQIRDLEVVPRREIAYRGVTLEEMDVDAVIARAPEVASSTSSATHQRPRLETPPSAGGMWSCFATRASASSPRSTSSTSNRSTTSSPKRSVTVRETIPDWVVTDADQVVNLDISAEDLRQRLLEGKIYVAGESSVGAGEPLY